MTPELKLQFQQKLHELQIHASLGVDEKNISKITDITEDLYELARKLFWEVYPVTYTEDMPENDAIEAKLELNNKRFANLTIPDEEIEHMKAKAALNKIRAHKEAK